MTDCNRKEFVTINKPVRSECQSECGKRCGFWRLPVRDEFVEMQMTSQDYTPPPPPAFPQPSTTLSMEVTFQGAPYDLSPRTAVGEMVNVFRHTAG